MAEKLSVQIELEGGAEIARQLEGIGKAGVKAFQAIGREAEKVGGFDQIDPTDVTARLAKMGITGVDSINKIQTAVQQAGRLEQIVQGVKSLETGLDKVGISVDKFANRMAGTLGPLGVFARALGPLGVALGVAGAAFIKFGNDSAKALAELNTQGAQLGLTAQQFDKLQQAFGKLGVPADAVTSSMEKLKGVFSEGALMRLGDIAPPEVTAALQQFIAQLERMPDGVARTQTAVQILGAELGGKVIAGLQTGSISAANFAAALASVTPATQEQIANAERYEQSLVKLSAAWAQLKADIGGPVTAPIIEWLASQLPGISAGIATTVREFQALWNIINTVGTAGAQVIGGLVQMVTQLGQAVALVVEKFLQLVGLKSSAPAGGSGAPGMASGGLLGGRGTGTSDSNLAWLSRGEYVTPARVVRQPGVLAFLEAMRRRGGIPGYAAGGSVGGTSSQFSQIIDRTIQTLRQVWEQVHRANQANASAQDQIIRSIFTAQNNLTDGLTQAIQTIDRLLSPLESIKQKLGDGNARGGLLGGRGSGTSDSNLAWVSRGEYITPARAVAQPGVLAFLEALRRSGGNLRGVLDGMGRFALGGMIPAFAAGGSVGSMSHVTIAFPGLPPIGGLRASASVVDQLHKAAALAQVRSGGRKPSRYS